ncbi:Cna B-type domain-containing protein [Streptococcus sp. ACC21]|uniref:Cna B-type domain-containing protein n=1 Tax=Streptococcus sp. ACC21 TaxID=1161413 RepID=UPI000448A629|nr:Cna B-type domain-containing protein [Streptococcus sp. ACC21]EUB12503.1 putative collagen adhesin [Streptococcus sp. ACC21]
MKAKRWIGFFLSLLTIFTVLGFWNVQRVSAADVTNKAHFENLKVTVAETGSDSHIIIGPSTKTVELKYSGDFSFPNVEVNDIKPGDYFIVKAPDNLDLQDQTLDLIDKNSNTKMGTVQVDSKKHQLLFTFNDKVKDKQNIRGSFVATAQQTVEGVTKKVTYTLPGGVTQEIEFEVKKHPVLPHTGELIHKQPQNDPKSPKIIWSVRINRSKTDMGNHTIKITDNIGLGAFASYIEKSFELSEVVYETTDTNYAGIKSRIKEYKITMDPEEYKKDSDNTALLTFVNGKRGFELLMPTNMGTKSFYLRYLTTSPADESEVKNSIQYLRDNEPQLIWKQREDSINTKTSHDITIKTVKSVGANVTADIAGKIKITKFDEADADVKLAGVVFEIREKTTNNLVDTVTTNADGIALSKALSDGKYIVKEKTPKSGYQVNSQEFEVEMKDGKGVPLNISNKRVTVDFEATKTWKNGKATDYKEVKLGLYVHKEGQTVADAKPVSGNYTPEVTESNGVYTYKWKNQLPERDVDGSKLVYSVRELEDQTGLPLKEGEKVKAGENNYLVSYNADKTQVTNTYEVPKINVTAKKVWVGGQERVRPTTYFKLYRTLEGGTEEAAPNAELKKVPTTDGTVKWTGLPATDQNAKKYTYSVKEVDDKGELITKVDGYTPSQIDPLTIKNTYSASPAEAVIEAKKKLEGRPTELQDEEFEFILKDNDGKEVQRIKNKGTNADGTGCVVFNPIKFTKEGHYQYTIVEAKAGETENGITYDNRTVPVIVHVYDNGRGQLVAWVEKFEISQVALPAADFSTSAPGSNLVPPISGAINTITDAGIQTFTNTYKATKVKVPVAATKSFINKNTDKPIQLQGGEFEFALFEKNGTDPIQTTTNDATGNIKFEDLEFNKADTYHYTIVEKNAGTTDKGITYSNKTIEVTIKVVDNGKGALEATVTYDNNDSTFENTYKAENAKAVLEVDKKLSNRNLEANMFEFTLTDQVGNVEKAKNGADGKVKFSELTFDEAGTYTYTIKEVNAGTTENGITYDAKTVTAKVTVTDDGQGKLHAAVEYSSDGTANSTTFTNVYTPAGDTSVTLGAKKVLEGKTLEAGKYSFVLKKADGTVVETVTNAADGTVTFSPISYNESQVGTHKYTISEVAGSETGITYDKTVREVEVKVEKISATELKATVSKEAKDLVFTNKYTPAKMQIPVKKIWDDADNQDGKRPTKITVKLLADGQDTDKTLELSEANGWAGNFTDLDADKGGAPIDYKVVEVSSVAGYTSEISGDAKTGFTITNKYTPETIDIKATKNWDDANNQDGKRPKYITVNLLADGEKVASKEVKAAADGTWSTVFTKLPKFKAGKVIKYSLTEEVVSEYTSEINDFNITNKYTPKMIDYQVTKTWNDNNNQDGKRPDHITVHLMKTIGGVTTEVEKYDIKVAEADPANGNVWKHTFTNLPKYEAGQEIVYSVKEDAVAGYETSIKGQEITNTHEPETIVISGKKVWEDANNQDGKRTKTVKVQILKGGTIVDEIETSEEKGWAFESKPLPKYENGKEIKYDVKEVAVESYEKPIVEKSQDGKYTITNKRTPEKVNLTGQKTWNDANNQDNIRPTEIKVRLLADGKDTGKMATASAATGWKYSFEGLDRYKDGKEIVYSVEEVDVPKGYQSKVNGMNLVNSHTPEVTSVSGQKTWDDDNDKDGLRPKEIQVRLLANGKDTGKVVTAGEATGWKYSFEKLAKYEAGKEITYTVEEVSVPEGYTPKVDGMNITNRHTPEKPQIPQTPPSTPEKSKKKILPSTGSQNSFFALLAGLFTLSGVAYLLKKKA